MHSETRFGTLWIIHCCTPPDPPRCLPCPDESFQCCDNVTVTGNSLSTCSESGARPKAHHAKPYASIPSFAARPPCPCVLSENESTSDTARFHCECPAQICAVCWLPGEAATCRHNPALEQVIFPKLLCVARRRCMPIQTQQLVAAIRPGFKIIPSGKT